MDKYFEEFYEHKFSPPPKINDPSICNDCQCLMQNIYLNGIHYFICRTCNNQTENHEKNEKIDIHSNDMIDNINIDRSGKLSYTRSKVMKDVVSHKPDADYIDQIGENRQQLYDLILGANYMDIKSLLHLGCAKVASLIKGQPLEKIKDILDPNYKPSAEKSDEKKSDEKKANDSKEDAKNSAK